MSRYDIADFLGLAVETVSRMLTGLRNARVISLDDPHRLVVRHPAALDDACLLSLIPPSDLMHVGPRCRAKRFKTLAGRTHGRQRTPVPGLTCKPR